MSKEKSSRRFKTLILLACFLGVLTAAPDGRNSYVKADTHPVCAALGAATALLGGTVKYCGASGTLGFDLQLDMQSEFLSLAPAEAFVDASVDLLGQAVDVDVSAVDDAVQATLSID